MFPEGGGSEGGGAEAGAGTLLDGGKMADEGPSVVLGAIGAAAEVDVEEAIKFVRLEDVVVGFDVVVVVVELRPFICENIKNGATGEWEGKVMGSGLKLALR
jgi:hypothetical protein